MPNTHMIIDVKLIRFTWITGDGVYNLDLDYPVEVIKEKNCDRFRLLSGRWVTVDHTWVHSITINGK